MSRLLFLKELKQNRKALITWVASVFALQLMTMSVMPTMMGSSGTMVAYLHNFPDAMLKAFNFDIGSFSDPLGFFVTYNFMFGVLLGGIFAGVLGAKGLHKEQALGTAEFLLTKPLSRVQIAFTKILACLFLVTVFNIVVSLGAYALLNLFTTKPFSAGAYWVVSAYSYLFTLGMAGLGFLVSMLAKRSKSMTGPATGIVLGLYLLDMVAKMSDKISALGWISPFKWVDIDVLRPGYSFEWERVAAFLALALFGLGLGTIVYRRKDILS